MQIPVVAFRDTSPQFNRAFGGEEWKECINLQEKPRRDRLLELYKKALRKRAGVKYVVSFLMFDREGVPLYWLLFGTNSLRGLEEMKKAMWSVDKTGEFRFSDKDDPSQLHLLKDAFDPRWLAEELRNRLGGRKMTVSDVVEFVLVETPCYLFREALKSLETKGDMKVFSAPPERRPATYKDDMQEKIQVQFPASMF
jgi:hypothetical protein